MSSASVSGMINSIVYTSAPRAMHAVQGWQDASALQTFTDVAFINSGFNESDIEIRHPDKSIEVVFNCTRSPVACAAQEASVSPDGKRIVFSVSYGSLWQHETLMTWQLGDIQYAKLYIYDVATKTVKEIPHQSSKVINRMPDWIDDNTIVYASNAANLYPVRDQWNCHAGRYPDGTPRGYSGGQCVSQSFPTSPAGKAMQIWRMNVDGTGKKNLTKQESMAIRPKVLRNPKNKGRIAYSSWQNSEDEGFYAGGEGPGTVVNHWWLMTMAPDGTAPASLVGAHHSTYINKQPAEPQYQQIEELMAVRAPAEDRDGRVCFTNYYRGNHEGGLGTPYCVTPPLGDFQVEGCSTQDCYQRTVIPGSVPGSGQYIPPDMKAVFTAGVGSDNNQNIDSGGRTTGVMGYLSLLSNGHLSGTWGQGWCMSYYDETSTFYGFSWSISGQPLCDMQIVELLVDQVGDPFDPAQMRIIAGDKTKHEFDASEIYPRPIAHVQPPLDPARGCFIEVADLRNAELYPADPEFKWYLRSQLVGVQGNSVKPHDPNFHKSRVKSLAFYGVKLHSTTYPEPAFMKAVNYTGYEDVWYMGRQAMLADGSLKAQVPCEQPLIMAATDANGKWITHDSMLHSLQKGETKTCFGCHDGHSVERRTAIGKEPQAAFATTAAANTTPPLLSLTERVTFAQVAPIISKACSGCHKGFDNDLLLWSRVFADQEQLDFPWTKRMKNLNGQYWLPRPYFSPWFARYLDWSPWYWYAVGRRTDGYTNEAHPDDVDFHAPHPTVPITPDELSLVVKYVQLGAPGC